MPIGSRAGVTRIVALGQRLQVIHTLTENQLSEDVLVIVAGQHIGAVFHDTGRIDDDDGAVLEFRSHGVTDDTQGKRFSATTVFLHHEPPRV